MPWSSYWIAPWMFVGPLATVLLMICVVSMSLMTRVATPRHSNAKIGPIWLAFRFIGSHGDRPTVFKEGCVEQLLRSDKEQRDSHEFVGRLCAAKDRLTVTPWLSGGIERCHAGDFVAVNKPRVLRRAVVGATARGLEI